MRSPEQSNQLLKQGLAALNQQRLEVAEASFEQILAASPDEPNALFLLGATRKLQGSYPNAIALMKQALGKHSNPAQIHNSLGNIYKETGAVDQAISSYSKAVEFAPDYAEAHFNTGLAQQALENFNEALKALETAVALQPENASIHNALGTALKNSGYQDKAETAFKQAIALQPGNHKAHHNLGALLRNHFRYKEALLHLSDAVQLAPRVIEPRYIMANIYYDLGDFENADKEYRTVIGLKPDFLDAHQSLNKLYWEHGKTSDYGKSYIVGIKACPQSAALCEGHLRALENAGRTEEAMACAEQYLSTFPNNAALHQCDARLRAFSGHAGPANDSYARAINLEPDNPAIRLDAAKHLIQTGDYSRALEHLDVAERFASNDQRMWAYRGLCWMMQGDERYDWLNNFDVFVAAATIEKPSGYDSLPDFLNDLKACLRKYHTSEHAPIDQTLRGGSQTHGKLFDRRDQIIQQLQNALKGPIEAYLDALPTDPAHPLCRRNTGDFDFSASWSVWLKSGGFHVNHLHTMGWVSSSFYVDVPKASDAQKQEKQGWIKFGESALSLGERDVPRRFIEPEPGLLALFPSYMWHGTVAFEGQAERVTAPFDIVPA